jgi:hypothetical protein
MNTLDVVISTTIIISAAWALVIAIVCSIWANIRDKDVKSIKEQAIALGVAEWHTTTNGETSETTFQWKHGVKSN